MRYFLCFLTLFLFFTEKVTLSSEVFELEVIGKNVRQDVIKLPSGKKYVSFKHSGGFKTSIAKYGSYFCEGSIYYDNKDLLENMNLFCELTDQNGDSMYTTGKRKLGSETKIAVGKTIVFDASGFWKKYIGLECTYVIEYVNDMLFSPQKCRLEE